MMAFFEKFMFLKRLFKDFRSNICLEIRARKNGLYQSLGSKEKEGAFQKV